MKIYPYSVSDVSPNALRSTWNPDGVFIGKYPQQTNMSHQEKVEGWCGTTCDVSVYALGVVDTKDDGWFEALSDMIGEDYSVDREELEAWIEDDEYESNFECDVDKRMYSRSCSWVEDADSDDWWPTENEGWRFVAWETNLESSIDGLNRDKEQFLCSLVAGGPYLATVHILSVVNMDYDDPSHETYDSGSCGTDWAYVAIKEDDYEDFEELIEIAGDLAEIVNNEKVFDAMLKAYWENR